MIHQPIAKPFGDDDDANRAITSVLSIIGQLSVESRKLIATDFRNINVEQAQRELVRDLYERVASRARSVHADPDEFLEAARISAERRFGRKIIVHWPMPALRADQADPDTQRLKGELLECQIAEQAALRRLNSAREKFTTCFDATKAAQAALDARLSQRGGSVQ